MSAARATGLRATGLRATGLRATGLRAKVLRAGGWLSLPVRRRSVVVVAATLLAAAATAAVGPIGFVGLAVPHIVRTVTGVDHRWLLPYCLVAGPVLLLLADILGRIVARPAELMVGIITAFVGAPILLLAVRRMTERE